MVSGVWVWDQGVRDSMYEVWSHKWTKWIVTRGGGWKKWRNGLDEEILFILKGGLELSIISKLKKLRINFQIFLKNLSWKHKFYFEEAMPGWLSALLCFSLPCCEIICSGQDLMISRRLKGLCCRLKRLPGTLTEGRWHIFGTSCPPARVKIAPGRSDFLPARVKKRRRFTDFLAGRVPLPAKI